MLTSDHRLIRYIDEAFTYQAPWVRRLEELDLPLPEGPPWGRSAEEAALGFARPQR